ncbi:hypothetical protein DM02DRAFT_525482 [Periconia macrospinosa]|uniref:BTB domain-containing protein n=1 Tax=Periconia macrospinosa TaxID=97972 RepID=A0A2V1DWL2_9PLEO|nr:hypothetical protein DM02DRAFT_525482 [Periconia macrospinosa]
MATAGVIVISPEGDLVLDVRQEEGSQQFSYRVKSGTLRASSRYFDNLLSDRFSEGQSLLAALDHLKISGHTDVATTPVGLLPRIRIVNVGRIGLSKGSNIQNLMADFLSAIHGQPLATASPPVANLANLAVVADRFDAVESLAIFVQRRRYLQATDAKSKSRTGNNMPEERARQKLLVGVLFDHPPWVTRYSKHLIMRDSAQWRPGVETDDSNALWWDLPYGMEDELIQRREHILETINSIQSHFLKLYTSGERQCKLGYDTSRECDSYQLGEMVRFFTKTSTLRLQGTIYDNSEPTYYLGDIDRLLESLRQCSSYQIDRNHAHCGLRSRMIPLLDLIQNQLSLEISSLDIGICAECWKNHRPGYAWSLAKRPIIAPLLNHRVSADSYRAGHHRNLSSSCLNRHIAVRDFFLAVEKNWAARDAY